MEKCRGKECEVIGGIYRRDKQGIFQGHIDDVMELFKRKNR